MIKKITNILEEETGGKSYKAHKYSLDNYGTPSIDFGGEREGNVWKKTMETTRHGKPMVAVISYKRYKELTEMGMLIDKYEKEGR